MIPARARAGQGSERRGRTVIIIYRRNEKGKGGMKRQVKKETSLLKKYLIKNRQLSLVYNKQVVHNACLSELS